MSGNAHISPPVSEQELLARAAGLAGKSLQKVARQMGMAVPADQKKFKGWIGELAECWLGATAANRAEPDFPQIGVELKTIPMNGPGKPRESTYVCTVSLTDTPGASWETSVVWKKLRRVLWLPVEAGPRPLPYRRFGDALLWSPSAEQQAVLRNDWEEIMELIGTGELDQVSATHGRYLQIRPKAANAASLGRYHQSMTLPRGFYLRASFTKTLFEV